MEAVYHEAIGIEFTLQGIPFLSKTIPKIRYKRSVLNKKCKADFLSYDKIIVEIKSQSTLMSNDQAQLINYLKATELRVGVLINFGSYPTLEWKRFIK